MDGWHSAILSAFSHSSLGITTDSVRQELGHSQIIQADRYPNNAQQLEDSKTRHHAMKNDIAPAKNVPPAFVLNWTSTRVEVRCPFASCDQKVHGHGYSKPTPTHLNTRAAHCYPPRMLEYRLLFPYEDDPLVRNFGFFLDRQKLRWTTIAHGLKDPRDDEEVEQLSTLLAGTRISEPSHQYVLDAEDAEPFLLGDYDSCKHKLETSKHLETLVKGKYPHNGRSALSLVCSQGHLEIAELLYNHGAELDSVDDNGQTPLMLATINGYGQIASYLARLGASLFINDKDGKTLIQIAKTAYDDLATIEWSRAMIPIYSSEVGSSDAMEQVNNRNQAIGLIKARKEGLSHVIDLYAALKPERDLKKSSLTNGRIDKTFSIIQSNEAHRPRYSFSKVVFETHLAKETKTFAFLDRGLPFENIQAAAVSGYTPGEVGNRDGCLDRVLWTSRAMKYCRGIGHELAQVDQYGNEVPKRYHACHAEKQLMAYFLWMHTTADRRFEAGIEDGEIAGNCDRIHDLQTCKPDAGLMKKDIYVSRKPCPDCKLFQQRVYEKEGILFNLFFIKPVVA